MPKSVEVSMHAIALKHRFCCYLNTPKLCLAVTFSVRMVEYLNNQFVICSQELINAALGLERTTVEILI